MDLEKMEMHRKVYDAYVKIMQYDRTGRIAEVDASKTEDEVFAQTYAKVKEELAKHGF
jgi:thymidylate kinase